MTYRCLERVRDCIGVDFNRYTVYKALEGEKEEVKMSKPDTVRFLLFCDFAETVAAHNH